MRVGSAHRITETGQIIFCGGNSLSIALSPLSIYLSLFLLFSFFPSIAGCRPQTDTPYKAPVQVVTRERRLGVARSGVGQLRTWLPSSLVLSRTRTGLEPSGTAGRVIHLANREREQQNSNSHFSSLRILHTIETVEESSVAHVPACLPGCHTAIRGGSQGV